MRQINTLVIHCSASPFGDVDLIRQWHLQRGFQDIGYHYVILNCYPEGQNWQKKFPVPENDGKIQPGRPLEQEGAHVQGHNADSVGICLLGDTTFTGKQLEALKELVGNLLKSHPNLQILGHYELDSKKTCPNLDMDWVREYLMTIDK